MKFYNLNKLLSLLLFTLLASNIYGQTGKLFWFVAPDISATHGDSPIGLRVTAKETASTVSVSWPANPGINPIILNIAAFEQVSLRSDNINYSSSFNVSNVENKPLNTVNNKGMLVEVLSGGDVSVYYEVLNSINPDIFTNKGLNALGQDFYVPSQNHYPNRTFTALQPLEQVNIVATEDNTTITIIPSDNLVTGGVTGSGLSGTPITIILDKGETYSIASLDWKTPSKSLGGTHITSDKDIAVTVSDDSIEQRPNNMSSAYDLIGDQIVPTSIIGNEYIAMKASTLVNALNKVFILAIKDNTTISIDDTTTIVLAKGETREFDFSPTLSSMHIISNNSIYAYQVSGLPGTTDNEMGSAILPAIANCSGSNRVSFTRNYTLSFWVQIMTQQKNLGHFKMFDKNGAEVTAYSSALNNLVWSPVSGTDWVTASIDMSKAPFSISTQSYSIANTEGLFHLSVLDQNGGSVSFGYFSDFNYAKIEGSDFGLKACAGEAIMLKAKNQKGIYSWKSSITENAMIGNSTELVVTETAQYYLTNDGNIGCTTTDTIDVEFSKPIIDLTDPGIVCPNEDVIFTLPNEYKYLWSTGDTTNSTTVKSIRGNIVNVSVTASTKDELQCTSSESVSVRTYMTDTVSLASVSNQLYVGDTIESNKKNFKNYNWFFNGVMYGTTSYYTLAFQSGIYKVITYDTNDCISSDSILITVNDIPTDYNLNGAKDSVITIFPNPTTSGFTINGIKDIAKITVVDSNGITLISQEVKDNSYISASGLRMGIYVVRVSDAKGISDYRLIKK